MVIGYGQDVPLPALSLIASPTKRLHILELAEQAERSGFPALACPTLGNAFGLCASLAHVTHEMRFYTSIQGIYGASASDIGSLASHIAEVSKGRFALGLGVSHEAMVKRLGVSMGPPLSDMKNFVDALHASERFGGPLPPIYLATLRDRMLNLATEIGQGALWANASFTHSLQQVRRVPADKIAEGFYLANMIPTIISEDKAAARAANRATMAVYVRLPNYRNYWKACGYVDEMEAIEVAIANGNSKDHSALMSDAWLDDCTLSGSADEVRDGLDRWYDIGVQPIAVMSSVSGGQIAAIGELFDIYR